MTLVAAPGPLTNEVEVAGTDVSSSGVLVISAGDAAMVVIAVNTPVDEPNVSVIVPGRV